MSRFPLLILAALLLAPDAARAGFTLSIESKTVSTGDVFTIDVIGTGTSAADTLNNYGIGFQITGGGAAIPLQFVNNVDATDDPTLNASNYIFFGHSTDATPSPGFAFGTANTDGSADPNLTTFAGGDESISDIDYGIDGKLLARLKLVAPNFVANAGGDTYTITLLTDPSFSYFTNSSGDETLDTTSGTPFGTVTVQLSAVPEPSTIVLALFGLGVGLVKVRRARGARQRTCV